MTTVAAANSPGMRGAVSSINCNGSMTREPERAWIAPRDRAHPVLAGPRAAMGPR